MHFKTIDKYKLEKNNLKTGFKVEIHFKLIQYSEKLNNTSLLAFNEVIFIHIVAF